MSKKLIIVSILCLVLLGGGFLWMTLQKKSDLYKTVIVKKGNIDITVLSTGVVQPENRLGIKPPITGRIEKIFVKEGQKIKKGGFLAIMSSTERAALLDAARAQSPEELKQWEDVIRPIPIIAPIDGTLIAKNIEEGQTFTNQEAIFVMSDHLTIKAQVDETDISQIKLNQTAQVVLDAFPHQKIEAIVDKIAYEAKTTNNVTTYVVDVLPTEVPDFMRSGMTANIIFHISSQTDVLLIPAEAIKTEENKFYVLVPVESQLHSVQKKYIATGLSDGKNIEVQSGLNENESILIPELSLKKGKKGTSNPFSPMGNKKMR
ncbi:MAG: efflux RND transporter periplasmic adaptor subunit [Deltaproteobacteria bacterium]|nr:efflux RND transporter periplasmic adaptor subunit [Deltaproteobacteria bacterium]